MSLFNELKRRNVFRVSVAYMVVAWLLLQVADILLENFGAPEWVFKSFVVLLVLGLAVAIFLAWAFELTPDGVKRADEVTPDLVRPEAGRRTDRLIVIGLIVVVAVLVVERFWPADDGGMQPDMAATGSERFIADRSIAVLPFVNMSGNPDNEYFSDGLTETLLHMLAQVSELRVAARTSAFAFKNTNIDVREIATQLGVATVLEGSVQRAGERVRVTAQLIDARDGSHLWSGSYDRTLEDIFAIQDEIATEVATALRGSLLGESVTESLDDGMTRNREAYDLYLRAADAFRTGVEDELINAERWLRRALVLDPEFALGWSLLSETLRRLSLVQGASWVDVRDEILATAERGAAIAPNVAQTQATVGRAYEIHGDDLRAVNILESALELHPGNPTLLSVLADVKFGFGAFSESVALSEQAMAADPLDLNLKADATYRLAAVGRIQDALALAESVLARNPGHAAALSAIGNIHWRSGNYSEVIRHYHHLLQINPNMRYASQRIGWSYHAMGEFEHAERLLRRGYEQNPQAMADDLGRLYWAMGDEERARAYLNERLNYELTADQRAWAERERAQMEQDWARLLELAQRALAESAETGGALHDGNLMESVALAADRLGDTETRDAIIGRFNERYQRHQAAGDRTYYGQAALARLYGLVGNVEKVVEHLEVAHARGFRDLVGLENEGFLDEVWADPRVQAVVERIRVDNAREFAEMRAVAEELGSDL